MACTPPTKPMQINPNAILKLKAFKKKSKFDKDTKAPLLYLGLSNPKLKSILSVLINEVANDFITTAENNPTEDKFQENIKRGLLRFDLNSIYLDTEDKERVCHYFEEIMDCVGLESSDGKLNNWMYDFDPNKKVN